ncbi:MAG: FKBP-type peptidyl-prolyl cis-trans isomerase [Candidatus Marinimicrobia bacterium]|nr:FKBP-type peptidyl-prolyl cis-trans isomerase [Candidatus Neomarinimicrobiota bacterium]MDP7059969.1 FKBP-type peptidyl-prolyl cis-trans isomerase [Candidatus Neomarinimicrobiota bacterium]
MACGKKSGEIMETKSGLKYVDMVVGDGTSPQAGQRVSVHYTGWLYDENQSDKKGKEFDSSIKKGRPFGFVVGVGSVIDGWDEGVLSMRVGGKRELIVPSDLGYGAQGIGPIPPNATLLFEVELLDIY